MTVQFRAFGLVAALLLGSAAVLAQDVKSDQEILIEMERAWDAAFHRQDAKFIETLLADEFIATYGDGTRGDKAKELSLATDTSQQVDSSRLDEFIVKTFGNTAVVWFTQHLVGPVKGKPTEVTYRYVDVWVIRNGRWQAVASQSTRANLKE
jgi:ketosteroid isomerase-like protein